MTTRDDDPDPRPSRRNDVVYDRTEEANGGFWSPYGRVWRRIDPTHVQLILCTKDIPIRADVDVQRVTYKGRWETKWDRELGEVVPTFFRYMASLRRLKQMAAYYHPEVWKQRKPDRYSIHRGLPERTA